MHSQSALSTEYVRIALSVDPAAVITTDTVQMAFPLAGAQPQTWLSGSWETSGDTLYARCLVGPAGGQVTLTAGSLYDVYVKVQDNPETVARNSGALYVT